MLLRVGLAVLISAVLIGGATFVRQKADSSGKPSLIGAENRALDTKDGLNSTFWPEVASTSIPNLTKTDLISQQLLSDYISLASSGQDSADNVAKLVQNYIDSLPQMSSAEQVTISDLNITDDTRANFLAYDRASDEIETTRIKKINSVNTQGASFSDLSPEFYEAARVAGEAYQTAAVAYADVPVPTSLVTAHVKLVNNYFSTAAGLSAISKMEGDTIGALAGMVAVNQNINEQGIIINEIIAILTKNGL